MSKHILFKGKKIHYSIQGRGKAVVLLHGFTEELTIWKYFTRKLSPEFTVMSVDLPGHGRSESFGKVHTMELMADAVHAAMKEAGISNAHMVGHSMGGYITLAFAEKYPRQLRGFTLFHSHAAGDSPEAQANRSRTIQLVEKDKIGFIHSFIPGLFDPKNIDRYRDEISRLRAAAVSLSKEAVIAALEGMKTRPDRTHVLAHTKLPVQFIIGKNDSRIPMELVLPQTVLPAHAEVLILDQVGHMGFIEAREETFKALYHFAKKVL
jgi:pimeloyl-ACP methyl ester carboxylesterase